VLDNPGRMKIQKGEAQPLTAEDARTAHVAQTTISLANDTSEFSLGGDPQRLQAFMRSTTRALQDGIPAGTLQQDKTGFKWVVKYCQSSDPPLQWMRPHTVTTAAEVQREVIFTEWGSHLHCPTNRAMQKANENGL